MKNKEEMKAEIFDKVKEYYLKYHQKEEFVPEVSRIPYSGRVYDENEIISLVDSALDFWLTTGRFAKQFEEELAAFLGIKYCLLTNSGSSANLLAISSLTSPKLGNKQLKPGDEVITVAAGFPTTVNPIIQNNLVPVFVDVDTETYNIQHEKIEGAISDRTKAIFIAHTMGNPFNLDAVMKIAEKYDLWVIEDNCDALGSRYKGKYTGTFGHIATFSFYPPHHITMGEGGALVTNDPMLKKLILSFRDWGRDCWCESGCDNSCGKRFEMQLGKLPYGYDHKYIYSHIGYNLKVTDMQAAIGVEQLKKLPAFIEARKRNFELLYKGLSEHEKYFILPQAEKNSEPSWFGFMITVKEDAGFTKNEIVNYLEQNKIATRMLFAGNITLQPSFENVKYRIHGSLQQTDRIVKDTFWIGVYQGMTDEIIAYMLTIFDEFIASKT
ncbi:lipopolysaccharide biosynthesis protein RfbH [uncultured Methanolobus sp.]|uniref:lipopolysaccharide biosynthesis protein RfbH n=1 Tax=uncultured Methanolobus sp. TaxID=218300 RepID=UPI002AAAFDB5|nr:lipopolysaccharide biosynthesis protein RfbH [uncultured Methanolobus sp.]